MGKKLTLKKLLTPITLNKTDDNLLYMFLFSVSIILFISSSSMILFMFISWKFTLSAALLIFRTTLASFVFYIIANILYHLFNKND